MLVHRISVTTSLLWSCLDSGNERWKNHIHYCLVSPSCENSYSYQWVDFLSTAHDLTQALVQSRLFTTFPRLSTNHAKSLLELTTIFTTSLPTSDSSPVPHNDGSVNEDNVLLHPISPIENSIVDSVNSSSFEIVVTNNCPRVYDLLSNNDYLPRVASSNTPTNIRSISFVLSPSSHLYRYHE